MSGLIEYENRKLRHAVQNVPTISEMLNHFTMPNNDGKVYGFRRYWDAYYSEYIGNIAMAKKLTEPEEIKATNYKISQCYFNMIQIWKSSIVENVLWY